jgi:hypothetical protein
VNIKRKKIFFVWGRGRVPQPLHNCCFKEWPTFLIMHSEADRTDLLYVSTCGEVLNKVDDFNGAASLLRKHTT